MIRSGHRLAWLIPASPLSGSLLALVLWSLAGACKPVRQVIAPKPELPVRSAERVVERVLAAVPHHPAYYSAKADVELRMADMRRSFKAQLRLVADSALWVSVVPALGIEVARALVTPDSLKFMDKMADTFYIGPRDSARVRFGLDPDLHLFQQALWGAPVGLDPAERYRIEREDGHYILSSREKRRFIRAAGDLMPGDTLANDRDMGERRLERTLRKAEEREAIIHRYWIEPVGFRVVRVTISDLVHDQHADVRYEAYGADGSPPFPHRISLSLSDATRNASGTVELSRLSIEGPLALPFRVPEKFKAME